MQSKSWSRTLTQIYIYNVESISSVQLKTFWTWFCSLIFLSESDSYYCMCFLQVHLSPLKKEHYILVIYASARLFNDHTSLDVQK